jgi:hypothetical protein
MHQAPFCAAAGLASQTTATKIPRINTETLFDMADISGPMIAAR